MKQPNISKMTAQIEALKTRIKQEEARKKDALARERTAQKKKARADETRKKILVGALALKAFTRQENPRPINELYKLLNEELTRLDDRELFSDLIHLEKDNQS